ncbi:fungal-specific transcription factor domain-containing protein [Amylocarpus encephaloides]|uniref:Fungal-specific transcription factor domain-containing protein n=1 Tax=Amylocarpus encephaloides TaxID=45428 RepID=A0A9P7YFG5_9HELO|nr:fungal-specific transcription factor domain-containing protein [Amylocarpus encephaloides]
MSSQEDQLWYGDSRLNSAVRDSLGIDTFADCTYNQPSNRRRNPAPQYIESLEKRLQRAETLLRAACPNVDLDDPNIDVIIAQRQADSAKTLPQGIAGSTSAEESESEQDAQLRSMITSTGQLDLDENGRYDFHGMSSGSVFIGRMREQFGGLLKEDRNSPFLPKIPRPSVFGSPGSAADSPFETGLPNTVDLPNKAKAIALCRNAIDLACSLLRFVHQPSFYGMVDRIYDTPVENFGIDENQFLPLLYVVMALGCMFTIEPEVSDENMFKNNLDQGIKYFRAARQMMDVTDCRDLTSLQAVVFMVLFLQSTANLSTCYSYIGIALRSSLRMGLHRNIAHKFNPMEREVRRRVFWIVRKMDTYVSALLGFPQMLSPDDIDQELPLEVDDEYISKTGILRMPVGKNSLYAAANAHTKLMEILAKVIKYIYPTKALEQSVKEHGHASYVISHAKIREIERDLKQWLDILPMGLRPGGGAPPEYVRVQQLLRLAYAHVQMMLYRPFLHYVSQKSSTCKTLDDRSYACAAACVSVSRNIVHITAEMKKRSLLLGAYWFTMYTTFFSILSLVFFVLENPDKPGSKEILSDAMAGKHALEGLAKMSQAADRCSMALKSLFEKLPAELKERSSGVQQTRNKRSAPSPPNEVHGGKKSSDHAHDDLMGPEIASIARARSFPTPSPAPSTSRASLAGASFQTNTTSNPNLRHSFHEMMTPSDLSTVGTPDSSTTSTSIPRSNYPHQQTFNINSALPDLSAMMFPSSDPFTYPQNQPMMEYDNVKQENLGHFNPSPEPGMFIPNNAATGSGIYDDLEGQLFGPLPPYLSQGQQNFDFQPQMNLDPSMMSGMNTQNMTYQSGFTPDENMNFVLTGDNGGWSDMTSDPRYRQ